MTGEVLHNDTDMHWQDWINVGPSQGAPRSPSPEPEMEEEDGRAAARDTDAEAQVFEALENARRYVKANWRVLCVIRICGVPLAPGADFCRECGMPARTLRTRSRSARPTQMRFEDAGGSEGAPSEMLVVERD